MAKQNTAVGVDFASDGVRLAAVQSRDDEPCVIGTYTYRWPPGAWTAGVVAKATVVREGLRQAFVEAAFPTRAVVLAIGGDTVHKVLEYPQMPEPELAEQIKWEAVHHIPFDIADVQLEYRVVGEDVASGTMRVLLTGFLRDTLDAHLAVAREAGLKPRAVEIEAEALRRVVVASGATVGERAVVASGATVGERAVAVVRASQADVFVAVLRGEEVVLARQQPAANVADGVQSVKRTLDFFEATETQTRIQQLVVAGPKATAWDASLRAQISVPIKRLLPGSLGCDGEVADFETYATAIGLALPGPPTRTLGAPEPGLWSRLTQFLGRE